MSIVGEEVVLGVGTGPNLAHMSRCDGPFGLGLFVRSPGLWGPIPSIPNVARLSGAYISG